MGRRSLHTPEQLRELVLRSTCEIIEQDGLAGVSAREIARRIGYSPGTLYNLFESLDDLVSQVEALLLEALDRRLSELPADNSPGKRLTKIAQTYLEFSRERPKLWNLITQHEPPNSMVPPWYSEKIERLVGHIERALAGCVPQQTDSQTLNRSARVLWAGLHGIASLSTTEKLSSITSNSVEHLVDDFVETYLGGLRERARNGRL